MLQSVPGDALEKALASGSEFQLDLQVRCGSV